MKIKLLREIKELKESKKEYRRDFETCYIIIKYNEIEVINKEENQDTRISIVNNKAILKTTSLEIRPSEITNLLNRIELIQLDIMGINETPEWLNMKFNSNQI